MLMGNHAAAVVELTRAVRGLKRTDPQYLQFAPKFAEAMIVHADLEGNQILANAIEEIVRNRPVPVKRGQKPTKNELTRESRWLIQYTGALFSSVRVELLRQHYDAAEEILAQAESHVRRLKRIFDQAKRWQEFIQLKKELQSVSPTRR
jgi:hypothetical protein